MSTPSAEHFTLSFHVPTSETAKVTAAVHETGAGTFPGGTYGEVCFVTQGKGLFRPLAGANPHTGTVGKLEHTEEDKVEISIFGRETVRKAVEALIRSHPYEVVSYAVTKHEDV
jgi:hypothetical protein